MPGVVLEDDEEVPVPLEELAPELEGVVLDGEELELLPMLPELGVPLVLLDEGVELVSVELVLGEVELLDDDELGVEPEVVVSVVDELDEEAGGVGGVAVVVLLLLEPDGGLTTVVLSLRSHPATPAASARAKALVNNILDFMGSSFRYAMGTKTERRRPPFPAVDARKFDATALSPCKPRFRLPDAGHGAGPLLLD